MRLSLRRLALTTLLCGSGMFWALNASQASPEDLLRSAIQYNEVDTVTKMLQENRNLRITGTILDATSDATPQIQRLMRAYQDAQNAATVTDEKKSSKEEDDDADLQKAIALSMQNKEDEKKESLEEAKMSTAVTPEIEIERALDNASGAQKQLLAVLTRYAQHNISPDTIVSSGYYQGHTFRVVAQDIIEDMTQIKALLEQAEHKTATVVTATVAAHSSSAPAAKQISPWQSIVAELKNPTGFGSTQTASRTDWDAMKAAIFGGKLDEVQKLKVVFIPSSTSHGGKTLLQWADEALAQHPAEAKASSASASAEKKEEKPVLFYDNHNRNRQGDADTYYLTNFHLAPINYDSHQWPCSEILFQALKFKGSNNTSYETMKKITQPGDAFRTARTLPGTRADWMSGGQNIVAMVTVVALKFGQNAALARKLMATDPLPIIEWQSKDAPSEDKYWAVNVNGAGRNWLGRILMKVRAKLINRERIDAESIKDEIVKEDAAAEQSGIDFNNQAYPTR